MGIAMPMGVVPVWFRCGAVALPLNHRRIGREQEQWDLGPGTHLTLLAQEKESTGGSSTALFDAAPDGHCSSANLQFDPFRPHAQSLDARHKLLFGNQFQSKP